MIDNSRAQEIISNWHAHYYKRHGAHCNYQIDLKRITTEHMGFKIAEDPEQWCGAWLDKYVGYHLRSLDPKSAEYRLSFWGDDDFGMVKDSRDIGELKFLLEKIPDTISVELLLSLGFEIF